jgi:hypothetical protein
MNFEKLVPNIFYTDITEGLKLFVDCLEFKIAHDELKSNNPFCVLAKDGIAINLFQNAKYPNLKVITLRPWGAKEFAVADKQLGIVIQQW